MKDEFGTVKNNSIIQIGNGQSTKFWQDNWCENPLCLTLQIPQQFHNLLSARVSDFIQNFQWNIPWFLRRFSPI